MFLATTKLIQILIILGVILLFFLTTFLNKKVKAPKDCKTNGSCSSCTMGHCALREYQEEDKKDEKK